jgi:hypothetical protein
MPCKISNLIALWFMLLSILSVAEAKTPYHPQGWFSDFGYPVYYHLNRDSDLAQLLKPESTNCYTALHDAKNRGDFVQCRLLFDQKNRMYLDLSKSVDTPNNYHYIDEYYRPQV